MTDSILKVLEDYGNTIHDVHQKIIFDVFKNKMILAVGNSAKVRNALIASNNILENLNTECVNNSIKLQIEENEKALSSPARNCDMVCKEDNPDEIWRKSGSRQTFSDWLISNSI